MSNGTAVSRRGLLGLAAVTSVIGGCARQAPARAAAAVGVAAAIGVARAVVVAAAVGFAAVVET